MMIPSSVLALARLGVTEHTTACARPYVSLGRLLLAAAIGATASMTGLGFFYSSPYCLALWKIQDCPSLMFLIFIPFPFSTAAWLDQLEIGDEQAARRYLIEDQGQFRDCGQVDAIKRREWNTQGM